MAGAEKKISVIVPIYKAEEYLVRCVDSLVGQTYKNLEIILVDDGSPDGCPALCDAYAEKDERIRVVHKPNGGLVSAWQAGVRASSGSYLAFVDSDDWVETDMLQGMAAYLSEGDKDHREVVCCNFVMNRPNRETKHYHGLQPGIYEGEYLQGEIKNQLLGHENRKISMSRCMKLFSRSLIEDNMQYSNPNITMAEDVNITLSVLLDAKRVVIMKEALYYHYFYNDASMVHKYDAHMYEGIKTLYETIREIYRIKGRENGEEQAKKEYIYLLFLVIKNELRGGASGYLGRVKGICREEENRTIVKEYPVQVEDKANRLLYMVMKHPNKIVIGGVRLLFGLYDRLRKG